MRAMKDSGVEWIGEIPAEWEVIKNKYLLLNIYSGGTPKATNNDFYCEDNGVPFVSISDMSNVQYVYTTKKYLTEQGMEDKNLKILPKETILYSIYATIGAISELKVEATISQAILALNVNEKINKNFYKYNLISMKDYVHNETNGNTQFNLNAEKVRNFYFVFPPLHEQQHIADYLDKKCAEIDAIISKQHGIIEKLQEYKLSLITETVTKGLNTDAEMKDSGIEWIGEIPKHWKIRKIKSLFKLRNEKNYLPIDEVNLISLYTDKGIVQHKDLDKTTGNRAVKTEGYKLVYKGDIVVNIILCWMGAIGRSKYDGVTSPAYDVYIPNSDADSRFYHYYFRTKGFNGDCYKKEW